MATGYKLNDEQRMHVVCALAEFRAPAEVQREVKELFGVEVELPSILRYDPARSRDIAGRWKKIFEVRRVAFLEGVAAIPIGHQAYRLRELGDLYLRAKSRNNAPLAAALLEQAAKEIGGLFTNRREVTIPLDFGKLPEEQLRMLTEHPERWAEYARALLLPVN